ncbi:Uncharacterized conserved protein, contains HEPN domain [Methylobacterium sp. 174MFSha1.1]|uniref:HepT-like ribonuclease domain-containing protein n=1 Tax=Methylobacterium sp. 174MFSha1.1 TaxID=1502749 RepID=UPI0008EBC4CA|nr:HepT-like ribonuclease domain-containing protein [Methylobacterium sp. 174MFSha1.1]SFU78417.1 Uncharacterized conserved protein, contains HEPN domain [Methylobacterium sp. 174MFSha1.1]
MAASRNPQLRLEHVRDEIHALTAATAGVSREAFLESYILRRTTEHAVLIISEAVKALPIEVTDRYPGPPWADIRGVGNILRHEYYAVDPLVLWNILKVHLPVLAPMIDRMIADISDKE